jgi:hypothetical protein
MHIFSYLAYPTPGAKTELQKDPAALEYCEATPAENNDTLIVVNDTPDEEQEKALQEKLSMNLRPNHRTVNTLSGLIPAGSWNTGTPAL